MFRLLLILLACLCIPEGLCLGKIPEHQLSPLYGTDHPDKVPDHYLVALTQNYTIEQHWNTIGQNLSDLPRFIHYDALSGYAAVMVRSLHLFVQ